MTAIQGTNRKLYRDIDVTTMYNMRADGMTNKQIANALGVCPATVYRYIGKKSQAVKRAEVQKKPPVIKPKLTQGEDGIKRDENGLTMVEAAKLYNEERKKKEAEKEKKAIAPELKGTSSLRIVSTRIKLAGNLCEYVVDKESDSIEISGTVLNGMLDRASLEALIAELQDIKGVIEA